LDQTELIREKKTTTRWKC